MRVYDKAESIYRYVVDKYPDHEVAPLVKGGLAQTRICQGDDIESEAVYQKLVIDHTDHPKLPEAVFLIAEGYLAQAVRERMSGMPQRAAEHLHDDIAKADMIIADLPEKKPATIGAFALASGPLPWPPRPRRSLCGSLLEPMSPLAVRPRMPSSHASPGPVVRGDPEPKSDFPTDKL
jgi:hypothetical protein